MKINSPIISIVTVVYNDQKGVEKTIKSVLGQTYQHIQYIIIDGNSTDGTQSIIQCYNSNIDYWVSENDKGIYDAMNKGSRAATGTWLLFMNAGDVFSSVTLLENIFQKIDCSQADFLYGDAQLVFPDKQVPYTARPLSTFWKRLPFIHQTFFSKTVLAQQAPFDINYKVCADYDFAYRMYNEGYIFQQLKEVIVISDFTEGLSKTSVGLAYKETFRVSKTYTKSIFLLLRLWLINLRAIFVFKFVPQNLVFWISNQLQKVKSIFQK